MTVNQWSVPLRHGDFGMFLYISILCILQGLLLLFSFCCSPKVASNSKSVLLNGLDGFSTGSLAREGLVLLVSEIFRLLTSGSSCGAGVTGMGQNTTEEKGEAVNVFT